MKQVLLLSAILILLMGCKKEIDYSAKNSEKDGSLNQYERKYERLTGTKHPEGIVTLFDGSENFPTPVYMNRNVPEFAVVAWNFAPSKTPFKFKEDKKQEVTEDLKKFFEETNTDAFIMIKGDDIVYEYYSNGFYPNSTHATMSAGKSITSMVWSDQLLETLDKKVKEVFPKLENTDYGEFLMRDIVDLRTELKWKDEDKGFCAAAEGYGFSDVNTDIFWAISQMNLDLSKQDKNFSYNSFNSYAMGVIGSYLSGNHQYVDLLNFYNNMGFEFKSGTTANFQGEAGNGAGQYFALRDFAKFGYVMANNGKINNKQIVSPEYIQDLFIANEDKITAWDNGIWAMFLESMKNGVRYYSNQWYVIDNNSAFAYGSFGQALFFNKETKTIIAKFSTYDDQDLEKTNKTIDYLVQLIKNR